MANKMGSTISANLILFTTTVFCLLPVAFHRSVCIDNLYYDKDGTIKRVIMTSEGARAVK